MLELGFAGIHATVLELAGWDVVVVSGDWQARERSENVAAEPAGRFDAVADWLEEHRVPLVVDPVMVASSGARLLEDDAVEALVTRVFPLATVVTPNVPEARTIAACDNLSQAQLAEKLVAMGAPAALVTGGHAEAPVDHLFDGAEHHEIPVERHDVPATHGAGCTHSATLAALLARGLPLLDAARGAAEAASRAVAQGLEEIGSGDGPVDVLGIRR